MLIDVIYSDENLIVINKPPGMTVHGGNKVASPTVVDFLIEKFPEVATVGDDPKIRPGIVHRLDKDTSGVMVVARNQKSFEELKKLFQNRQVEKVYHAIVCGRPRHNSGVISLPIGRKVKNPILRGVENEKSKIRGAREAITEYKVLKAGEKFSLVELKPKTGRMHQLRVHLKSIGHPVACDKIYGGKNVCCPDGMNRPAQGEARPTIGRQLLHAKSLSFSFPEGRKLYFETDHPEDFSTAVKILTKPFIL